MIISIRHEMIVFWSAFLCGQVIFFLFDFFRAARKDIKHSKIMVAVEDAVFCLAAFKIFFDMLYITNNGHMRWYVPAALISGFVIYFFVFSEYVIRLWSFVIRILRLIVSPFFKIFSFFGHIFAKAAKGCKSRILSLFSPIMAKFRQFAAKKPSNPHKTRI